MPPAPKTFSESWYRVAGLTLSLRTGVRVNRQFYRGEQWLVLHDPYNNRFFRLRPAAYDFVARLGRGKTVEQVWEECLRRVPGDAPGQEEVIRLLGQLYQANLLRYPGSADSEVLFTRFKRQREQEIKSRIAAFMFPRITLLDPDRFLARTLPLVKPLLGPLGIVLWLVVVVFGIKSVVDNFSEAVDQSQALLAPGNLFWLYVALVVSKILHEFGHAYICRREGGEVHRMGVAFLIFTPLPFVDATSAWSFRKRSTRILVGAAGMIVEVFIAAAAAVVWSRTGEGVTHSLAYNVMFIASFSTLLFNGNPLLRFDGYYILSDLLDIPNLHDRATRQIRYVVERLLFGNRDAVSPARTRREAIQVFVFGILSAVYRVFVFTSIILFVADRLLALGIVLAIGFLIAWVVVPVVRFLRWLIASPELSRRRARAGMAVALPAFGLVLLLRTVPFPYSFRAPGVIESVPYSRIYVEGAGFLAESHVKPGMPVPADALLVRMRNPELEFERRSLAAKLGEIDVRVRRAMQERSADLEPLSVVRAAVAGRMRRLDERVAELDVRAPHAGRWGGPDPAPLEGTWINRGTELGSLTADPAYILRGVVSQSDAAFLFSGVAGGAEIKVPGQAASTLPVRSVRIIPMEQDDLPSESLGWTAGGEVKTDPRSSRGARALEPFFQVVALVSPDPKVVLKHGMSARIRFRLPDEPLLNQWYRKGRRMLQKRYGL